MQNKKLMGIDYGGRRIGIALSDFLGMMAHPYGVYTRVDDEQDMQFFLSVIQDEQVGGIILGLPKNMEGIEETIAQEVRLWGERLARVSDLPIKYIDERLTSKFADDILKGQGYDWRQRKALLDQVSATIILQEHLNTYGGNI